jgi:hypothetical protein
MKLPIALEWHIFARVLARVSASLLWLSSLMRLWNGRKRRVARINLLKQADVSPAVAVLRVVSWQPTKA